jgi:polyisoprenoid-binding protein YceI
MKRRIACCSLVALALAQAPTWARAEQMTFKVLPYSRVTFKTDAPLETVIGNTSGESVTGTVTGDPARPETATGTVRVDMAALRTGIERRDNQMFSKDFLDTANEAHRYATFEMKGLEMAGPLVPGQEAKARLRGTVTIRGKPVDVTAEAQVNYLKLTPEQIESQKRFGFTTDNMRVRAAFKTSFTNHGMQVPQFLILKLSNEIQVETDITMARQ